MENLFYSKDEKLLFWIAGYTDNSYNVKDIISMLTNLYNHFYKICKNKQISTEFITKSSRYNRMRIFWCEMGEPPAEAFVIGKENKPGDPNNWTMWKWVHN